MNSRLVKYKAIERFLCAMENDIVANLWKLISCRNPSALPANYSFKDLAYTQEGEELIYKIICYFDLTKHIDRIDWELYLRSVCNHEAMAHGRVFMTSEAYERIEDAKMWEALIDTGAFDFNNAKNSQHRPPSQCVMASKCFPWKKLFKRYLFLSSKDLYLDFPLEVIAQNLSAQDLRELEFSDENKEKLIKIIMGVKRPQKQF